MRAVHARAGDWAFMTHGVVFGMYDKQNGPRGVDHVASLNWAMLMATRQTPTSKLQFRAMGSAEPWTLGSKGYPLLLQTGAWEATATVDWRGTRTMKIVPGDGLRSPGRLRLPGAADRSEGDLPGRGWRERRALRL